MPQYPIQASYTGDGPRDFRQEGGPARRAAAGKARSSVGGKPDAFYHAFGETDVVTIMDLPDNVTAAGVALLVAASGRADIKTTVLLTPGEVDAAVGDRRLPPTRGLSLWPLSGPPALSGAGRPPAAEYTPADSSPGRRSRRLSPGRNCPPSRPPLEPHRAAGALSRPDLHAADRHCHAGGSRQIRRLRARLYHGQLSH